LSNDRALAKMRAICLSFPDTTETLTWGKPHFRVADKIFAGCGEEGGVCSIGFKLRMEHAAALIERDVRVKRAPYVGHKGWVSMDASEITDWQQIRELVAESYGLIAPKKSLAKLSRPAEQSSRAAAPKVAKSGSSGTKKVAKSGSSGTTKRTAGAAAPVVQARSAKAKPSHSTAAKKTAKRAPVR
jgi:predicted DNA-binding protein (MmcQ/YjbR family)